MEWKGKGMSKTGERHRSYEKVVWAHKGLGHAHKTRNTVSEILVEQVDQTNLSWDLWVT